MGDPAEENDPPPESLAIMGMEVSFVNLEVTKYRTFLMENRTEFMAGTPASSPRRCIIN